MHKFYPVNKGRFSASLCKIYTVEVCMIIVEILSFFSCDFWCEASWKNFFISYKTSLENVKKSKIKIYKEVTCLFFAVDSNFFSGVFVNVTFASSKFAVFYKTIKLPWENLNLVSLIFF